MTAFDVRARMEELGVAQMRLLMSTGGWPPGLRNEAIQWLAEKDREERLRDEVTKSEEIDIARSARDAAWHANDLAKSANSIALAANASAERSAVAAIKSNRIAAGALVMAIVAIAISIVDIFVK